MKKFSKEFKEQLILKSQGLSGVALSEFAASNGVLPNTLYFWRRNHDKVWDMSKPRKPSPEERLKIIVQIESLLDEEAGELLRSKGLHSSEVEEWKSEFYKSQQGPSRPQKDPELKRLQASESSLKKDLRRKDRALAEMSARVVLLKKSHEIWGVPEDDE